ncbi:membrane protein [Knoellia aerolata DSM 18566]|uniref:Membrane protein n=2 Tax=Knoellia TaxID=136099 RepID=A0A0A0JJR4_9MICO|nr:membrane protein [Knoellia aerolata DSM 18566]
MALLRAAHAGPALAVTVLALLLAVAADLDPARAALVTAAVFAGQLTVGWSNDLRDRVRDAAVDRPDKPLATGELSVPLVRAACALAVALAVVLSLACGLLAGGVHLTCVASAWTYNLWLKSTPFSWLPYAVSFGLLPVFVHLAGGSTAPAEVAVGAALLGVGAHLLNVVPDLGEDAVTGVRGLPHRLGARRSTVLAVGLLVAATVALLATGSTDVVPAVAGAVLVAGLAGLALVGTGRAPFWSAVGIALVDVAILVVR